MLGSRKEDRGVFQLTAFTLVQSPGVDQLLAALLLNSLLVGGIQVIHLDSQFTPHEIEEYLGDLAAGLWGGGDQGRVTVTPNVLGCTEFIERPVLDLQQ